MICTLTRLSRIIRVLLAGAVLAAVSVMISAGTLTATGGSTESCGDVPQFLGDAAHSGAVSGPGPIGSISVLWRFPTSSPMPGAPAIVDGVAYFVDGLLGSGGLRAVDTTTGTELWNVAVPGQPFGSTPAVVDGTAFVGDNDGNLTAIDVAGRAVNWTVPLAATVSSSPTVGDGAIFVNAEDVLYAVDPGNGSTLWSFANGGDGGYTIESSPAVLNGIVYATSWSSDADESLWALDAATGEERWSYRPTVPGLATPTVVDGVVYAGGPAGLVALDAKSGEEIWTSPIGDVFSAPAVSDKTVIVHTNRDMVAVDASTGQERWRANTGGSWSTPAVAGDAVYVGSNGMAFQQSVHVVDTATGAQLTLVTDLGSANAAIVVTGGVLYAGTDSGVAAIGTPGANGCAAAP